MFKQVRRYESGPGDPEWESQMRERVRTGLEDQLFHTNLNEADLGALRDRVFATRGARLDYPTDVAKIARQMLEAWEFSSALGALRGAKGLTPKYDSSGIAAKPFIFKLADELDINFADHRALAAVITQLGEKGILPLSESGQQEERQARAVAQDESERSALIQSITRGHKSFPIFSPAYGKAKNVDSASLEHETTERLREIDKAVAAYRSARDGARVDPIRERVNDEGISATFTTQKKTAGYMGSDANDEFLAHPSDPTREYTPREVKQNIRELLFINGQSRGQARVNAINRVLRGEQYTGPRPGGE